MDLVAALEAQHLHQIRENCPLGENGVGPTMNGDAGATSSPKEARRNEQKKRWKNWSWKYSPGGKTTSIEEEPESPKKTSLHSSPNSSPKHKKSEVTSASNSSNNLSLSPIRRKNRNASASNTGSNSTVNRVDIRSSAGARLCQMLDDSQDESGDEFQALLANGRPASVHIVQMSSSGVSLLNNDV